MKKRILSLLLVALILIGMIPVSALAAEEHGISVNASAPVTAETTQGGMYTLNMSDVFTDSEGHDMTYTLSGGDFGEHTKIANGDNGYYLNFTVGTAGTYNVTITAVCANDASVSASHTVEITVKEAEDGDENQYGYDETPQKSVKAFVTISNDGVPLVGNDGTTLAHLEVDVPYFDLGLYDLQDFYRYSTENGEGGNYTGTEVIERPTLLHLYIYMLGVYYVGCTPEDIISGAAKDSIIGADGGYGVFDMTGDTAYDDTSLVLNITGSSTSLYMQQFWGHDENLMYYRNHVYPLMRAGWGSTADYILLSDNDVIDLAMFSNWSFWQYGAFACFDKDDYSVKVGEELTFKTQKYDTKSVADGGTEQIDPITGLNVNVYNESWQQVGVAELLSDGGNEYKYTFETPGTYYIVGLDPNMKTDDACYAPANSKVVVTGGDTPVEPDPTPDYEIRTLTFEDADYKGGTNFAGGNDWSSLISDPQYGSEMLYPNGTGTTDESKAYTWTDAGNTELTHMLPKSWDNYCYWGGGHAVSNYVSGEFTKYGDFNNQLTVYKKDVEGLQRTGGGHNGSDNFAVHFGYKDNSGYTDSQILPSFSFADGVERVVDHMYVNNICYATNCYLNGNGLTAKIGPDDWVKLTAYGYDAEGNATGSAEIYLCNGPEQIITDWTKFDLSGLGKVLKVEFNITGSSDNGYGFSQPAYFAYDDVAVRFEKGGETPEPPAPVSYFAIGDVKYETLQAAVDAVKDGETITMLEDASGDGVKVASGKNFTIDFGGHTYTVDGKLVGSTGTETLGFQLLKDSTIVMKNGTLTSAKAKILIQNYSNLTLQDMNVDVSSATGDCGQYALSNNCGDVNITGATSITAKEGGVAFDVCCFASYPQVNVTVDTTGTITGTIEFSKSSGRTDEGNSSLTIKNINHVGGFSAEAGTEIPVAISGGTFSEAVPEKYCAEGFAPAAGADGKYTVEEIKVPHLKDGVEPTKSDKALTGKAYLLPELQNGQVFENADGSKISYTQIYYERSTDGGETWGSRIQFDEALFGATTIQITENEAGTYVYRFYASTDGKNFSKDTWTLTLEISENIEFNFTAYVGRDYNYKANGNVHPIIKVYPSLGVDENNQPIPDYDNPVEMLYSNFTTQLPEGVAEYDAAKGMVDEDEEYNMFYFSAPAGTYCYEAFGWNADDGDYTVKLGGMQLDLPTDSNVDGAASGGTDLYFQCNSFTARAKVSGSYVFFNADEFYIRLDCPIMKCSANIGDPYVSGSSTYYPVMVYAAGNAALYNTYAYPTGDEYMFTRLGNQTFPARYMAVTKTIDLKNAAYVTVNVPEDAEFGLYYQWNNFNTTLVEPVSESTTSGVKSYTYKVGEGDSNYTWRLSQDGYVTRSNWGIIDTNGAEISLGFDGASTDIHSHDFTKLGTQVIRRDEADLMVNLDPSGFEVLTGTTRIRAYRHWEIINNDAGNIMIEPDFHWNVLDGDASVEEVDGGNTKANWADVTPGSEDSIIAVYYDAMEVSPDAYGSHGGLFPATNPERVGVVIAGGTGVQHGTADADVDFNMAAGATTTRSMDWDYNYDTWFFDSKDEAPSLDFAVKATGDVQVSYKLVTADNDMNIDLSAAWTAVNAGEDGRYVIDLLPIKSLGNGMGGTVIIRMEDSTGVSYRLVRVAKSSVTLTNATNAGEPLMPGDKVTVRFDGLYRAVNKISGIFNPTTFKLRYTSGDTEVDGTVGQYQQMDSAVITMTIPEDVEFPENADTTEYAFTNGYIYGSMYSAANPFAFLYNMTDSGVGTNFNAVTVTYYISRFADIVVPVQKTVTYNVTFAAVDGKSGDSISDVKITVKDADKNVVAPNADGTYDLRVGTYTYELLADGYDALRDTLVLSVNSENDNGAITVANKLTYLGEGAWDGKTVKQPAQDENGVYLISNAAELAWFAGAVNGTLTDDSGNAIEAMTEISGKVVADIALAGREWTPIGNSSVKFAGTFDGGGHTISGLYVAASGKTGYLGLFGYVSAATVAHMKIDGEVSLKSTESVSTANVGGVVGYASSSVITDITSDVDVLVAVKSGGNNTGGVVGYYNGGDGGVINCVNNGSVTGMRYTGGVVGNSNGASNKTNTITNCVNNGNVTSTSEYAGGIAGFTYSTVTDGCTNNGTSTAQSKSGGIVGFASTNSTVRNCENNGKVTATSSYSGGIIGDASTNLLLENCVNNGEVYGDTAVGITGNNSSGNVKRCVNYGAVNGKTSAAGIVGNTQAMTISECANFGDVTAESEKGYVGGIVYYGYQRGEVINCYNAGKLTGAGYVGGIAGEVFASNAQNYKITNCYNVGELNGQYVGGIIGQEYTDNEAYSAVVTNSYYLDSVENAIGAERNGYYTLTDVSAKTSEELKALAATLGEAYEDNKSTYNNGYPVLVWQEIAQPVTVNVDFTAQALGGFLCAPQKDVEISSDLAESYGYKDDVPYGEGVSALDVLVKAHEIIFGDAFTAETKDELLVVRSTGTISTIFGTATGNCGFTVNGMCPVDPDSTKDDYGYYSGYTITQAKILDGDALEFFIYQDSYAMDNYLLLTNGNEFDKAFTVEQGENLKLTAMGYSIGWYGTQCKTFEEIQAKLAAISDAQLAIVDTATGAMTDITGAITGEDGTFTLKFDNTGTYVITAYMPADEIEENYATPVIMTLATITVTEKTTVNGDANGDGVVDATDAVLILRYYADAKSVEAIELAAADVNGDGIIDANDAVAVLRIYAET